MAIALWVYAYCTEGRVPGRTTISRSAKGFGGSFRSCARGRCGYVGG